MSNLGDRDGALENFRRALALLEPLRASSRVSFDADLETVGTYRLLSAVTARTGRPDEALRLAREALAVAEALHARAPGDERVRRTLASAAFSVALTLQPTPESQPYWDRAEYMFRQLLRERPEDPDRMRNVALVHKYVGARLQVAGDQHAAVTRYREALALDERRLAMGPVTRQVEFDVAIDLSNVASSLARLGRREDAIAHYDRSIALREALVAADPQDALARSSLGTAHAAAATLLKVMNRREGALPHATRAIEVLETNASDQGDMSVRRTLARALWVRGWATSPSAAACRDLQRGHALNEDIERPSIDPAEVEWQSELARMAAACPERMTRD